MARETNTLPTDYLLQEYRVDSVLGTGGFGITYKAQDTLLETWVAIKEYFPVEWSYRGNDGVGVNPNAQGNAQIAEVQASGYDWGLSRFLEEARVLARVQHPYVVRVRRYFRANGSAYIVMDFEEGEPLSALLRREQTLSEADLRGMLDEVLPALEAVHQEGYLHRDLKPSNLYVRARDGCVMLIDFGAARQSLSQRSKSITGLVTPGYSPPEQYITRSDHYGPWTDIYALGGVLYRCISGRAPTEAPDRQMWDSLPPAVEAGAGRYSPDFLAMIDKALAMRPEERFQHIEQMRAVLKKLASNESDKPVPSRFAPPAVKREPTSSQDPKKRISSPPPQQQEPEPEPLEDPFSESDLESLLPGLTPRTRLPEPDVQAKQKPKEESAAEDDSAGTLLPVFRSRLLTQRRLPSAGSNQEPTAKPSDDSPLNLDKPDERVLPELEPLTQQPDSLDLPDDPLTTTADQPTRLEQQIEPTESDVTPQELHEQDDPRTQGLMPATPLPAELPEPVAEEPALPETEQVERPSPLRRRKQQQNVRLGMLLIVLLVAIGWVCFTVYQDYQDKARANEAQQQRQQEELARRLAAEQAEQEQEAARRLEALDYIEQARIELLQGDFEQANALIDQAEVLHPENSELVIMRGEIREAETRALAVRVEVEPKINMPFVSIPGGCFQMGSSAGLEESYSNETQHQVCLEGFWLSQHEVTNDQYRLFKPTHSSGIYKGMTLNNDRQPVAEISWQEATDYARWLSQQTGRRYRLPTEAEWEYAARAGTGTVRYWGDDPSNACEYANVADQTAQRAWGANAIHACDDEQAVASPVASYQQNPLKLFDMLGNVSEWTCSEYVPNYGGAEKRCSRRQPTEGSRTIRGGSWDDEPRLVRAADRNGRSPDSRDYGLGFRLVRED